MKKISTSVLGGVSGAVVAVLLTRGIAWLVGLQWSQEAAGATLIFAVAVSIYATVALLMRGTP